jgi:hypothetical protein
LDRKYESESSMKTMEKSDSKSNSHHSSRDSANKRYLSPPLHSRKRSRKSRSRSGSPVKPDGNLKKSKKEPILVDLESSLNDEAEMMKQMGFGSFDSTKGKHVSGFLL